MNLSFTCNICGAINHMEQFPTLAAGFREVLFLTENVPELGIIFDQDVSQPLLARKDPFALDLAARTELINLWRAARDEVSAAVASRWLQIGRKLGFGPKATAPAVGLTGNIAIR